MEQKGKTADLMAQFVERIDTNIRNDKAAAPKQSIKRRKLRTVTHECGFKKASLPFLARLRQQVAQAGLFTDPSLVDPALNPEDWVRFSREPFPSKPLVFRKEEHLQQLVLASLGQGVFRNLKPFRSPGNQSGMEYGLPNGRRIDLLCREKTKHRAGTLVAIELKRHNPPDTVDQLVGYLDALKKRFPEREVRGIIISSSEDPATTVSGEGRVNTISSGTGTELSLSSSGFHDEWVARSPARPPLALINAKQNRDHAASPIIRRT